MIVLVIAMALPVTVDAVNISKKSVVIKTGSKITLSMQKISKKTKVSWSSSSPKIASVKAKGQSVTVTGKKAGNSVITAKVGSKTYHCQVTVKPKLKIAIALRSVGKDGVWSLQGNPGYQRVFRRIIKSEHPEAMGSSGRKILKKFLQVCD